jgi:methyl-accepting chemotaxis protein
MAGRDTRRPFTHSLMGRLTLAGIVPALVVILVLVVFNSVRRYHTMEELALQRLSSDAQALALRLDAAGSRAVETARLIATTQEAGQFGDRKATLAFLRRVLEQSPDLTGTYVVYEPNADGRDATGRIPGATLEPGMVDTRGQPEAAGRFVPYWFRNWKRGDEIDLKPNRLMETGSYYQTPRTRWLERGVAAPLVTEPYEYEGQYIVEQTWPIVIDGAFKGIAGVDRSLVRLRADIEAISAASQADVFILSPGGRIVLATDSSGAAYTTGGDPDTFLGRDLASTPYAAVFSEFLPDTRAVFTHSGVNPGTGMATTFVNARVATGGWLVVMCIPNSHIWGPILADLTFAWSIALIGVAAIVVILWVPAHRLVKRVDMAASAARQVAAGDLTRESCGVECPDETGELLRSLDSMTQDLNTLVGQVRTASIQLTSTATELAATSRQQEEVAASFGASSAEIAAAVREITATGQELAREMVHVSESAGATARLAQEGRTQLETMEGAMQSLDHATGSVAERLAAINEKAVNITGVVTTITKVAEQTNLLSVNAAIEAEKAGEYGRGFLVVAREIRRLADQTAQATLDIERMVKEMQAAVSSGVMEMDRFSDQVRRNVGDVRGIGRSMQEIIVRVDEGTASFATVREGMQSQAAGASQISEAMAGLTANAKATGDSVREFGRAAEELQKAIGTLKAAVAAFHLRA